MIPQDDDTTPPGGGRARDVAAAVRAGTLAGGAVAASARAAAARWEPWLGAVVELAGEAADPAPQGPLAGVAAGVKDLLWVRGLARRCGAPELTDPSPAPRDAAAVGAVRAAGASIVGTLQTHQFGYGTLTPQTRNPRAPERVAGGSSGGAAAAIAAGMVHVALGTDTGGSVRIPAACCGVVGIKPTFGAVPVEGVQPLAPSLDTVGPLAGDVADAALVLSVLLGRDIGAAALPALRIGVPAEATGQPLDGDVRDCWLRTQALLRDAGAEVAEVSLPALADAPRANNLVLAIEALRVHGGLLEEQPVGWWPQVRDRLERARSLTDADRRWAEAVREEFLSQFQRAMDKVDVLLTPTLPCTVPRRGQEVVQIDGHTAPVIPSTTRLTGPWNLLGAPAGSVPAGRDGGGAPIGMQVVGRLGAEETVVGAMALIEELAGGSWPVAAAPA